MPPRKSTPAAAPSSPRAQRSAAKSRPRRAGSPYTAEVKAGALHQLEQGAGLADVHRSTGVTKATLSRWAKAAGIVVGAERTKAATEARVEELALDAVSRLERIRDYELTALETLAYLEAVAAVALETEAVREQSTIAGPIYLPADGTTAADAGKRIEALKRLVNKRDLVGAAGLIVDKLETLAGRTATTGELVVRFGIPRPDFRRADAEAVDLPPSES